jgi:hypothetical protein
MYKENGPLTSGEARTLVAMMIGREPEDVQAFIVVAQVPCDCGSHRPKTTALTDCESEDATLLLARGIQAIITEVRSEDEDT